MSDSLKRIDEVLYDIARKVQQDVPLELNVAKAHLERLMAAERLDELSAAFIFDGGHNQVVDIDGKILLSSSSIRFQDYYDNRARELEQLIAPEEDNA